MPGFRTSNTFTAGVVSSDRDKNENHLDCLLHGFPLAFYLSEELRLFVCNCTVREDTSSGRKCDVTFLLFLRKYAKIGKNNREKLVPNAKSSLPVSRRNIREL